MNKACLPTKSAAKSENTNRALAAFCVQHAGKRAQASQVGKGGFAFFSLRDERVLKPLSRPACVTLLRRFLEMPQGWAFLPPLPTISGAR